MKILSDPKKIARLYPARNASRKEKVRMLPEFNMNVLLYLACTRGFEIKLTEYVLNSITESMAKELKPLTRRAKMVYANSDIIETELPERIKFAFDLYEAGYKETDFFTASTKVVSADAFVFRWLLVQSKPDPKPGKVVPFSGGLKINHKSNLTDLCMPLMGGIKYG